MITLKSSEGRVSPLPGNARCRRPLVGCFLTPCSEMSFSCFPAGPRALPSDHRAYASCSWHSRLAFPAFHIRNREMGPPSFHSRLFSSLFGILVPQSGIKPEFPAVEAWRFTHGTAREFLHSELKTTPVLKKMTCLKNYLHLDINVHC